MFGNKIPTVWKTFGNLNICFNASRSITTTSAKNRDVVNRKEMLKSLPAPDEGTVGENTGDIDLMHRKYDFFM